MYFPPCNNNASCSLPQQSATTTSLNSYSPLHYLVRLEYCVVYRIYLRLLNSKGSQVGDECETKSMSPAFKPPIHSPSIEVASGAAGLAKLLLMFCRDSGCCQRTSLTSTLSLVRHSHPTATQCCHSHLDGVNHSDC